MSQPASQPFSTPPAPKKRNIWPLVIVVAAVGSLLMVALITVSVLSFLKNNYDWPPAEQKGVAPKIADLNWGERKVGEITLEAPCEFAPAPYLGAELPDEERVKVDSMTTYIGLGLPTSFIVKITEVVYMPKLVASLKGAVRGTMSEDASLLGDFAPKYESKPIVVSGVEGRRSHYQRAYEDATIRIETLIVCKENRLWAVKVIYTDAESAPLADRLLKSVTIEY
jgi:hypothetical protein